MTNDFKNFLFLFLSRKKATYKYNKLDFWSKTSSEIIDDKKVNISELYCSGDKIAVIYWICRDEGNLKIFNQKQNKSIYINIWNFLFDVLCKSDVKIIRPSLSNLKISAYGEITPFKESFLFLHAINSENKKTFNLNSYK